MLDTYTAELKAIHFGVPEIGVQHKGKLEISCFSAYIELEDGTYLVFKSASDTPPGFKPCTTGDLKHAQVTVKLTSREQIEYNVVPA